MKTILITGFEPFGNESTNPSFDAVKSLPAEINGCKLIKHCLPVVYKEAGKMICRLIDEYLPDYVIMVGQAGGRKGISVERTAVNIMDSSACDNAGYIAQNEPICENSPDGIFASVPINKIKDFLVSNGIDACVSNTAGTFICNLTMYSALDHTYGTSTKCGFIHVPYSEEQIKSKPESTPYMKLSEITRALELIVTALTEDS